MSEHAIADDGFPDDLQEMAVAALRGARNFVPVKVSAVFRAVRTLWDDMTTEGRLRVIEVVEELADDPTGAASGEELAIVELYEAFADELNEREFGPRG